MWMPSLSLSLLWRWHCLAGNDGQDSARLARHWTGSPGQAFAASAAVLVALAGRKKEGNVCSYIARVRHRQAVILLSLGPSTTVCIKNDAL